MNALRADWDPSTLLWSKIQSYKGTASSPPAAFIDFRTLLALRRGDTWAQDLYLETFWPVLESEVRRYSGKGGDREELHQEAALALWEAAFRYDPTRHRTPIHKFVTNHIHRLVREQYVKCLRHQQIDVLLEENRGSYAPNRDNSLHGAETRMDLQRALRKLSPREQKFLLHFVELAVDHGMGIESASRHLADREGMTMAAAKKKVQRLRHKWQNHMKK